MSRAIHLAGIVLVLVAAFATTAVAGEIDDLRKRAERGDALAQFDLGVLYARGEAVPENQVEAAKWYRRAAEQGVARAQSALGAMYHMGKGVPKDAVLAYMWLNLAAAKLPNEPIDLLRDSIAKDMTRAQVAEAQKLARAWMEQFEKRQGAK